MRTATDANIAGNRVVPVAFPALGATIVGCFAGWRLPWWGALAVLAAGALGLLTHRLRDFGALLLVAGAAWIRWETAASSPFDSMPDSLPVVVEGTVIKPPEVDALGLSVVVRGWTLPRDDSRGAYGVVLARCALEPGESVPSLVAGSTVRAFGRLALPSGPRNPGGSDGRIFLASRGIDARVLVKSPERIVALENPRWSLRRGLSRLRARLLEPMSVSLPAPYDALVAGVLLGEKRDIPDAALEAFVSSGVAHVLVVSGANFALVTGCVFVFLRTIRAPLRWVYAATMAFALLFAAIAGFSASVTRAFLLAELVLAARLLERDAAIGNLVAVSAFLMLLARPAALFDIGFQLSFGATAALVFFLPRWNDWLAPIRERFRASRLGRFAWTWIAQVTAATFAVQLVITPILAWHFGRFSWVSLFANVPVVFLVAGISVSAAISVFAGLLYAPAAAFLANAALGGFAVLLPIVRWFAALPYASTVVVRPAIPELLLYGTAIALLFAPETRRYLRERPTRLAIAAAAILGCSLWGVAERVPSRLLEATFLDVGQGDAIFVRLPTGENLLVDAGAHLDDFDTGERVIAPYLTARGVRRLDTVIESHADNDHAGGLPYLVRTFPVETFIGLPSKPLASPTDAVVRSALSAAANAAVSARLGAGEPLYETVVNDLPFRVDVLYPAVGETPDYDDENTNNDSLVVGLAYGDARLLLTGDIERTVEETLVERFRQARTDIRADVLKSPHHGSATSSSLAFLNAASPRAVVVSVGRRNRFNHPSPQVLARYDALGARVYRTDRDGAVRVWTDGRRVWIRPMSPTR